MRPPIDLRATATLCHDFILQRIRPALAVREGEVHTEARGRLHYGRRWAIARSLKGKAHVHQACLCRPRLGAQQDGRRVQPGQHMLAVDEAVAWALVA